MATTKYTTAFLEITERWYLPMPELPEDVRESPEFQRFLKDYLHKKLNKKAPAKTASA